MEILIIGPSNTHVGCKILMSIPWRSGGTHPSPNYSQICMLVKAQGRYSCDVTFWEEDTHVGEPYVGRCFCGHLEHQYKHPIEVVSKIRILGCFNTQIYALVMPFPLRYTFDHFTPKIHMLEA